MTTKDIVMAIEVGVLVLAVVAFVICGFIYLFKD